MTARAGRIPVDAKGQPLLAIVTMQAAGKAIKAPCILAIGADPAAMETRVTVIGEHSLASSYVDPDDRRLNPAYRAVQEEIEARQREADIEGAGTQDKLSQAMSALWAGARYPFRASDAQLRAKLNATPRFIDEGEPIAYQLSIQSVRAEKRADIDVALIDRRTGQTILRRLPQSKSEDFEIARNLMPTDTGRPGKEPAYVDRDVVDSWLATPPMPAIDTALQLLALPAANEIVLSGGLDALRSRWQGSASTETRAEVPEINLNPGIVRVEGAAGVGEGFYVTGDRILTASGLVGDTSLVKVIDQDGESTYGVVDRRDDEKGLALLYVQRQGPALTLDGRPSQSIYLQSRDAIPGRPVRDAQGEVAGMVLDSGTRSIADAVLLTSFARLKGGLDAPARPASGLTPEAESQ